MAKSRLIGSYPVIGIRPTIDGRRGPLKVRESLEDQTMAMAQAAKKLFEDNIQYSNGEPVKVVIADTTIGRVAEAAKISLDAMRLEVNQAFKRKTYQQKKKQEKIDLAPAQALQPKSRTIRYDNIKSAVAEEGILRQILREPALLEQAKNLQESQFSSGLLGRVYGQLQQRYASGQEVSAAVLADLTPEEMSHITGIISRQDGPVSEEAFRDCVQTVLREHQASHVGTEDDLLALQKKLKERKGIRE